jgi:D-tyrosyl-tRNA(Tyr) deacylase
MIVVVQRASRAEVRVDGKVVGKIELGLVVLVGVERGDSEADADVLARKLVALRIFPGKTPMDLSIKDVHGACLVVSQFTLAGSTRKGNRPSFDRAEDPVLARALYERMAERIRAEGIEVATGRFAADMKVELVNDGPVTFILRARDGALDGALTGALTRE